jgi:hypothetical protein
VSPLAGCRRYATVSSAAVTYLSAALLDPRRGPSIEQLLLRRAWAEDLNALCVGLMGMHGSQALSR